MARDLKLQVVLAAIDKATAPIRSITQGSVGLARTMKETRETLRGLQSQQKDISSFKALKGANDQTRQAMQASTDRVRALSRELANTSNPTKALNNEFKRAVRESQSLKQKHGEQQRQLQTLRGRLSDAGVSTRNLSQHERDLRQKLSSTNQTLRQQEDRLKRVTDQQNRMAKAKASYEKSQQLAGSMAASGAAGMAAGGGILYAGARMMAPGIQFDADMAKVQALTRLGKDDEQLAALRAQARQLGAETMFSATEAAAGQGFLAMAGFDPQAILDAMPGMLDIAKAGDLGLAETADIVSNILTGMNLEAGETGRLGDVLVGAFTRSNTNLQMLGETMKYVGPIASSVGQDVETMAAMAGKLGDAGIQGSMGGTALRAIINRLSAPPKAAANALDELGVSAADAQGNMRDLPEVLSEIFEKTKDMGDTERAGLLKGIAGEEAVSALQVLVKQAGTGSLQEFIATLRETQGEAAETARVMGDNLVGDLDELSSAWEDLGIELQTQQNGPLREIVQMFAEIVGGIKSWVAENPELAGTIVKVVAGLAALVAAGGALTVMLASVIGPLAMIRYGMTMLGIQGTAIIPTLKALGMTITGLGKALLTTPLGMFVAAAVIAAIVLVKYWDHVDAFFGGFIRGLVGGFKAMAYALTVTVKQLAAPFIALGKTLAPLVSWFIELIAPMGAAKSAMQQASGAGEWLGRVVGALAVLVGAGLAVKLAGLAKGVIVVGKAFFSVSKAVLALSKTIVMSLLKVVALAAKALLAFAQVAIAAVIKAVVMMGKAFLLAGKALLANPIVLAIALVAGAAYMLWRNWDDVAGGLKTLWSDLVNSTRFIWASLLAFFLGIWNTIRTTFAGGISGISALIINWSPLGLFYQAFAGVMGYFGIEMPSKFSEFGAGLLSSLYQGLVSGASAVMEFFGELWQQIKDAFAGGIGGVSALILNWSPLGLFYQTFAGVLSYFGVDLPGKFTEFGGMLMSGMVQGIKNGLGAVKDAITGAGGQAIGWFKEKLGIRSPSRVFAGLGDDTMAGLKVGLERSQKGPLGSILKAGKALAGAGAVALGLGGAGQALAVDSRPPLQAASAPITVEGDTIHIQITAAPGTDSRELESMINRVLDQRERAKAARIRSALYDTE